MKAKTLIKKLSSNPLFAECDVTIAIQHKKYGGREYKIRYLKHYLFEDNITIFTELTPSEKSKIKEGFDFDKFLDEDEDEPQENTGDFPK